MDPRRAIARGRDIYAFTAPLSTRKPGEKAAIGY
jgi:hypothetical protein